MLNPDLEAFHSLARSAGTAGTADSTTLVEASGSGWLYHLLVTVTKLNKERAHNYARVEMCAQFP